MSRRRSVQLCSIQLESMPAGRLMVTPKQQAGTTEGARIQLVIVACVASSPFTFELVL